MVESGRRRLQWAIRGAGPRHGLRRERSVRWLAAGAAVAAGVTAAVVVVPGSPAPVQLSARQILLTAASAAAAQPSGAYWHLSETAGTTTRQQTWTARSGAIWVLAPGGKGVWNMGGPAGINVGGSIVSFARVQSLPTNPAALTAWMARSFTHPLGGVPPWQIPAYEMPGTIAFVLSDLLYEVPASPAVRAAAFRALAASPAVISLGPVPGGQKLEIPPPSASHFPGGKMPGRSPGCSATCLRSVNAGG